MDSVILPAPPPPKRALLLWVTNRAILLILLIVGLCLLPEPPLERPDNPMAMEGAGYGAGLALVFIWGISFDFIFSLPSLVFLPLLLGRVLALPDAQQRKRKFYGTVASSQALMPAVASFVVFKDESVGLAVLLGVLLIAGLYLVVGLLSARKLYAYWLADDYYWSEEAL